MVSSCAVFSCKSNKNREPKLHFHRFPGDKKRSKKWLKVCKRKDLQDKSAVYLSKNCTICDLHFTEDQFMNPDRKKLIWCAVPTIYCPSTVSKPGRKPPTLRTTQPDDEDEDTTVSPAETPQSSSSFETHEVQNSNIPASTVQPSVDQASSDEILASKASSDGTPTNKISSDETSANKISSDQNSVSENSTVQKSGSESSTSSTSAVGTTTKQTSSIEPLEDKTSNDQASTSQAPSVETSTVETHISQIQETLNDQVTNDQTQNDQSLNEQASTSQTTTEVPKVKVVNDHAYSRANQGNNQRGSQEKPVVDSMFLVNKIVELQAKLAEKEAMQNPQETMSIDTIVKAAETTGLNPVAASFFKGQLRNCNKKGGGGYRWTAQDKGAALGIYFRSESAYKLLSTIFTMPSTSTLQRYICDIPGMVGFNENMMSIFAIKAKSLSSIGKHCVLTFQEMNLRKELTYNTDSDEIDGIVKLPCQRLIPCNQVLVFMANGVTSNWKQPLAYFFGEDLAPTDVVRMNMLHIVAAMSRSEFKTIAVVCNHENCDSSLYTSLGVTEEKPYFEFESQTIYALYDTPKIMKDIRNTLIKGDIHFDIDKTARWEDIKDFYIVDRSLPVRLAPKLTNRHIHLQPSTPTKANLAAEVFSDSVYVGMRTLTSLSQLNTSADQTAEFLKVVNDIYEILNATNPAKKKVNAKDLEKLGTLQQKVKLWFSNEIVPECFLALNLNLRSVAQLVSHLLTKENLKFVLTGRLNQDCLEDFCEQVKAKVGEQNNPTVREFEEVFKTLTSSMMLEPITSGHCEYNSDELLSSMSLLGEASKSASKRKHGQNSNEKPAKSAKLSLCPLVEKIDDFQPTDEECNIVSYIGCYLLQRIKLATQCDLCLGLVSDRTEVVQESQSSGDFSSNCSLVIPSLSFINFLLQAEHIFLEKISELQNKKGILVNLQDSVEKAVSLEQFKQCSSHQSPEFVRSLLNIYLRCRLLCYLKFHTSEVNASDSNQKVKCEMENYVDSVETVNHILISDTAVVTLTDL